MRTLAVFCGSSSGNDPLYTEAAVALAETMADHEIALVYGGGSRGLMGTVAETVQRRGGYVVGVIPHLLNRPDVVTRKVENELIVARDMHERKALMYERSDGFVALPGGIGTLEELLEVYTWLQLGYHAKPVALLNVGGFFDHLLELFVHAKGEGFIKADILDSLIVTDDISTLFERLDRWDVALGDKLSP
ncbi:MAG: TIGR00730 family Rossman fold protein [Spirochaetales bacterium]|nr:TIGR00730 family Rossman fold protein [Spirochaetales bacterium]